MGNLFKRKPQAEITRINHQQTVPLIEQEFLIQRRNPANQVTIGKNFFHKKLTDQYMIKRQTREILGRYYLRFDKKNHGIKIGIERDIIAQEDFVHLFMSCLVESHMSGYVFIGIKLPLLKDLAKVNYTNLRRLQIVNCNIDNIEPITFINSDKFETIYLSKNIITNINSLAKTRFPEFLSIQLDQNFITDFKPLTRAMMTVYTPEKKNKFFVFTTFEGYQNSDLGFIFKAQNTELCIVSEKVRAVNLIRNNKVFNALRELQSQAQPAQQ